MAVEGVREVRFRGFWVGGLNSEFRVICLSNGGVLRCILL
jgi:hypothetical protein